MKFIKRILYVPKHEKIPEATMTAHTVVCTAGILISLTMLSMTTWAWFSDSAAIRTGTVQTADYRVVVTVKDGNDETVAEEVHGAYSTQYRLPEGKYDVSLRGEGSAQNGYCRLNIGDAAYYTTPLLTDGTELDFTVELNCEQTIEFHGNWGSYSGSEVIASGEVIFIGG